MKYEVALLAVKQRSISQKIEYSSGPSAAGEGQPYREMEPDRAPVDA